MSQDSAGIMRAGPELSSRKRQNRANKSRGGIMPRAEWRAQRAKQGVPEWEAKQTIGFAGISGGRENDDMMSAGRSRRYDGWKIKGMLDGAAKGRGVWMVTW